MRYIVFALVAVLFSGVAHAQQGNLPKPVGKLPPYPPVVCVTPNWTAEPCADRQPPQANENRWEYQCDNVNVKVTMPRDSGITEYILTGVEKSNNRFRYEWGKDELYLNGKLCALKTKPEPIRTQEIPDEAKCGLVIQKPCEPATVQTIPVKPRIDTGEPTRWERLKDGGLRLHNALPPEHYDYFFSGPIEIIRVDTPEQLKLACNRPDGNPMGCAQRIGELCRIRMLPNEFYRTRQVPPEMILRHEMAHCNGWAGNHPGARPWDNVAKK
jgi:hypothetical protein